MKEYLKLKTMLTAVQKENAKMRIATRKASGRQEYTDQLRDFSADQSKEIVRLQIALLKANEKDNTKQALEDKQIILRLANKLESNKLNFDWVNNRRGVLEQDVKDLQESLNKNEATNRDALWEYTKDNVKSTTDLLASIKGIVGEAVNSGDINIVTNK